MTTTTLAEQMQASLTNSRCAVCDGPAVNQFVTHWAAPGGFAPVAFTCTKTDCEQAIEGLRDSGGYLTLAERTPSNATGS